jgi:hypothetical protein
MRAHSSGRVTSLVSVREMQCAGVRSYILQWYHPRVRHIHVKNVRHVLCAMCEVIRVVQIKVQNFWNIKQCRMVNGYQHFERDCAFHLQGLSKRLFFSAWPAVASPTLCQCCFIRRMSGWFSSRWREPDGQSQWLLHLLRVMTTDWSVGPVFFVSVAPREIYPIVDYDTPAF